MSTQLSIIGGYLGSGKSTLVNRLLAGALPGRVAVVVNDFGSVNIDAELIAASSDDTIELTNGCICCQINDDATRVMSALAAREDLDHVLCEASGVADPRQLAAWRDFPGYVHGPLLVCADATNIVRLLHDEYVGDTVALQLAGAETVLLTKADVALPAQIDAARAACARYAPQARLIVQDPAVPEASARLAFTPAPVSGTDTGRMAPSGGHGSNKGGSDAPRHAGEHSATTLETGDGMDITALARALGGESRHLVRAKGIVQDQTGAWHELQLASGRITLESRPATARTPQRSRLVLIAAGPQARQLVARSAVALAPVFEPGPAGQGHSPGGVNHTG